MTGEKKTVLVVDDDPDSRTFLTTVLQDNGFATATAQDGKEALASIERQAPSLVALDISMPEKSGVSVYRTLKEGEGTRSIPVIIITGVSEEFEKFISSRRTVPPPDGYISKPVEAETFLKMVRGLTG